MSTATSVTVTAPSAWKRATRSGGLAVGLVLAVAMVAIAIAAPWIAPFDPNDQDVLLKLEPPSAAHWFGTDAFGRDVLSRVIHGAAIATATIVSASTRPTARPPERVARFQADGAVTVTEVAVLIRT